MPSFDQSKGLVPLDQVLENIARSPPHHTGAVARLAHKWGLITDTEYTRILLANGDDEPARSRKIQGK